MANGMMTRSAIIPLLATVFLLFACSSAADSISGAAAPEKAPGYPVVQPGTHPGLLFCAAELPAMRLRTQREGLPGEAWQKIKGLAAGDSLRGEWTVQGLQLDAMALIYQVEGDRQMGRSAVELFKKLIGDIEPFAYYKEVDSDFFETEHWPKAFALAWDWLYELMDESERQYIRAGLELWCKALFEHTESWWWQDASYNCGAIPVGALGLLCTSIQAETAHPEFQKWFSSAIHRIQDNYFPTAWRANGICYEGPCYAHYHKNSTQFGEALRRTGGPDIITTSGAVNAMHYQRFQWMPQGGCGPIGDNTNYGRRVFQAIYLFGIRELRDQAGLWTFEKYTDRRSLNPLVAFIFYPDSLEPVSPGTLKLPTSCYFEIAPNKAGYVYSRSEWDNERAAWFAFVTRYSPANHEHYDMNSFLFSAFGEQFATHENIFPYSHENHGVDFEHNLVVIDSGGMPAHDRNNSAGDDCSINGFLTGVGLGHFADYVRGDARLSYQDPTVAETLPAQRADRYCLFAKQGPNPYLLLVDDIQKSGLEHDYFWQWYTPAKSVRGAGTLKDPLVLEGQNADCAIAFLEPAHPEVEFKVVQVLERRRQLEVGLIRVHLKGVRERFAALAAAWEKGRKQPVFSSGQTVEGNPQALSFKVEGENFSDLLLWQPEEYQNQPGETLSCGKLAGDGFLNAVRLDEQGKVTGYVLGDGRSLAYAGQVLVRAGEPLSVSADSARVFLTGRRRARQDQPPLAVRGGAWLPGPRAEVYADGELVRPFMQPGGIAVIGEKQGR